MLQQIQYADISLRNCYKAHPPVPLTIETSPTPEIELRGLTLLNINYFFFLNCLKPLNWLNVWIILIECFDWMFYWFKFYYVMFVLFWNFVYFWEAFRWICGTAGTLWVDWCLFCLLGIIYIIYKADPSRAEVPNFQTMPFLNHNSWQVDISKALS